MKQSLKILLVALYGLGALPIIAHAQPIYGYPPPGYRVPYYYPPPAYAQPYGGQPNAAQPAYRSPQYAQPRNEPPASIENAMLAGHNAVRQRLGLPALTWSAHLAAFAREWGNHLLATGAFEHRHGNHYGENLYAITGSYASPAQVVRAWADESRSYDFRTNTCSGMCGHYTQIVWRGTRSVGCAAVTGGGRQVWVCNYDPPGNWVGYPPY
jgi:uncharacterized protein YkwD